MNLRGIRESGTAFAVPTYVFMVGIIGHDRLRLHPGRHRHPAPAESAAATTIVPEQARHQPGRVRRCCFLLLRAFSSGCAALTGVEAISNGVPAFRKPKSQNAATTLLLLGVIAVTMLIGDHHAGPR